MVLGYRRFTRPAGPGWRRVWLAGLACLQEAVAVTTVDTGQCQWCQVAIANEEEANLHVCSQAPAPADPAMERLTPEEMRPYLEANVAMWGAPCLQDVVFALRAYQRGKRAPGPGARP